MEDIDSRLSKVRNVFREMNLLMFKNFNIIDIFFFYDKNDGYCYCEKNFVN